jgi:hypothetical protein
MNEECTLHPFTFYFYYVVFLLSKTNPCKGEMEIIGDWWRFRQWWKMRV